MKKLIIALAVVLTIFMFAACASQQGSPGGYFSDVPMEKRGEASCTVWFAIFGSYTYPPAETVARDNGITKISSVEQYSKLGTFGLWTVYTTIVTGE
jgi:hypothetical protein